MKNWSILVLREPSRLYLVHERWIRDPTASTHLPLVFEATAHSLKVRAPPVAPMPATALPAVPLRLLQGSTASPGVIQKVSNGVRFQHPFLWAQGRV